MNADTLAALLVEHGLHIGEAPRKRTLLDVITRAFRTLSTLPPVHAWWVPGRLEVFGKHTDYCGGHSMIATLPRGFIFIAAPRPDHMVRLLDANRGEQLDADTSPTAALRAARARQRDDSGAGWRRYAHVVVDRLTRNFPGAAIGADIAFGSDLPSAAGMSSSSALVVGLVHALVEVGGLSQRPEWRNNIARPADVAGYYACFENGASFGTLMGDAGVGTHGGSEDHVAIVCGAADHISAWKFVPIQAIGDTALTGAWCFVIAASGVAAQKIGSAREKYNSLSRRASRLLQLWNQSEPPQHSLFDALASDVSAPSRIRDLLERHGDSGGELGRRLDHFMREDRRVLEALEAFRRSDTTTVGRLSDLSQGDAEALLGNQVPETIALARSARGLGAFAASSFGAGFGGSVWALVETNAAETFAHRWLEDYRSRFRFRPAASSFVARPGPSLTRLL